MSGDIQAGIRLNVDTSQASKLPAVSDALNKTADSARSLGDDLGKSGDEVKKLLDKYDPLSTKLKGLTSDFAALSNAARQGLIGGTDDAQYDAVMKRLTGQITETKAAIEGFGASNSAVMNEAVDGAGKASFATAGMTRELIVLGHEAMTGNFSRMPGSFMVLGERIGITSALFSPLALGILGVVAAGGLLAKMAYDASETQTMFANALATSGNFAGVTMSQMTDLAQQMSASGQVTVGAADQIVAAYVSSGRIGGQALSSLSGLTADYARITGESADKAAEHLTQMFENPIKGAEEFARTTHELTLADMELITTLTEQGRVEEAQLVLAQRINDWTIKNTEQVGLYAAGWRGLKAAVSDAADWLGKVLTNNFSLAEMVAQQQKAVDNYKALAAAGVAGADMQASAAQAVLDKLNQQLVAEQKIADSKAKQGALNDANLANLQILSQTDQGRLQALNNQLTAIQARVKIGADEDIALQAEFAVQEKIDQLVDSMGAKRRQQLQEQITGRAQLNEVSLDAAQKENDAELKIGQVTQAQHDETKTFLELFKNAIEQQKEQQLANVSAIRGGERQAHLDKLGDLKAQAQAIADLGNATQLADTQKAWDDMANAVGKYFSQENGNLQKELTQLELKNKEIGKTKEQIDQVRASQEDLHIAELERDADYISNALQTQQIDAQERAGLEIYLSGLRDEIALRQQITDQLREGATAQAQATADKAWEQDLKHLGDSAERDVENALIDGGKKGGQTLIKNLENDFERTAFHIGVQATVSGLANAAGLGGSGGGGLISDISGGSNLISDAYNAFGLSSLPSLGAAVSNLSTIIPTFSTMVEGGAGIVDAASAALAGTASSFAAFVPWVGAGLALYSLISGGGHEDPHNNPDSRYIVANLGIGGATPAGGNLANITMGQTSGQGRWADYSALSQDQLDGLNKGAAAVFDAGHRLADILGVDKTAIDAVSVSSERFTSVSDAVGQLAINVARTLLPTVDQWAQGSETADQTLQRVIVDLQTMDQVTQHLGMSLNLTGTAADRVQQVENIIAAGGGSQAFGSAVTTFYSTFFSQQEQLANAQKDLNTQFTALGLKMPDLTQGAKAANDAFKQMVTGIDLSTSAGQVLFGQLIAMAPAFAQFTAGMDAVKHAADQAAQQAADAAAQAQASLQSQSDQLQIQLYQAQGNDAAATALQRQDVLAGLDPSLRAKQQAVWDAQDQAAAKAAADAKAAQEAADAHNALVTAYNQETAALQQTIAQMAGFASSLSKFRDSLLVGTSSPLSLSQQYAIANQQFTSTAQAASLGDVTALGNLQQVVTQFLAVSQQSSTSEQAYARDRLRADAALESAIQYASSMSGQATTQLGQIPHFAGGGQHQGGWRLVGENGPELEFTAPSVVLSNSDSRRLVDMSELTSEIKNLRSDIRQIGAALAVNSNQVAIRIKKWDKAGLPPTRS